MKKIVNKEDMMIKVGKWIAKHKVLIVLISMILLIPSVIGMAATRVNYDILSYLPDSLETVEGQDIMVDEFGMGAFSQGGSSIKRKVSGSRACKGCSVV